MSFRKNDPRTEHQYVEERLSAYLDGELTPQERTAVERHLAHCQACRWNLNTLRQTVRWVAELPAVPVPRAFTIPVATRPVRAPQRSWSLPLLQGATVLVALLLVVVVTGDFVLTGFLPAAAPRTAVSYHQPLPAAPMPTVVVQAAQDAGLRDTVVVAESVPVEKAAVVTEVPAPPGAAPTDAAANVPPTEEPQAALLPEATQTEEAQADASAEETPLPAPFPGEVQKAAALPSGTSEGETEIGGGGADIEAAVVITGVETTAARLAAPEPSVTETATSEAPAAPTETATSRALTVVTETTSSEVLTAETETATAGMLAAAIPTEAEAIAGPTVEAYGYQEHPPAPSAEPLATAAPTAIALAEEPAPAVATGREGEARALLSDSMVVWLGVAEITLLGAFILLASVTLAVMIRQRRM